MQLQYAAGHMALLCSSRRGQPHVVDLPCHDLCALGQCLTRILRLWFASRRCPDRACGQTLAGGVANQDHPALSRHAIRRRNVTICNASQKM
ncbi:hypothetical protein K431DRAFT_281060 [Polychaeton citri CBS 116435]|uniref:Uncharacterized protein n=1 Tax=Polychaeton citri CBS 116435 TaxID=1314669 RepID=A0A9P4QHJ7_9PEZI|nr:hypothetical protein K431DRAFT_281060 [Polychaeton citri CBS 116435]